MEQKQDYYLRISDKATNKILFRTSFDKVTIREAMLQTEKHLISDPILTRNYYPTIEICLTSISSRKIIRNIMDWKYDSYGNIYSTGWNNYRNEKKFVRKKSTIKLTRFTSFIFTGFFACSFVYLLLALILDLDNLNLNKIVVGFLNFLLGLIYTGIVPILRDEYNYVANTIKEIKWHNFKLELPSLLAVMATILSFYTEEIIFERVPVYVVLVIVFLGVGLKLMFDNSSDIDKFYLKKTKNLYM